MRGMLTRARVSRLAGENATSGLTRVQCLGRLLLHGVGHQGRPEHHLVRRDPGEPELVHHPARQQVPEELERAPAGAAGERVGVHVAAAHRHVVGAQGIEIAAALRQDAPKLLVVALARRLLVGLHRVAVEHAAAPGPPLEARALQALPVVELDAPVGQQDAEDGLEGGGGAHEALHVVEAGHGALRAGMRLAQVDLERPGHDVHAQDVVGAALVALDGIALHNAGPVGERERLEVGIGAPGAVDPVAPGAGALALALPHADLSREKQVGRAHQPLLLIGVGAARTREARRRGWPIWPRSSAPA